MLTFAEAKLQYNPDPAWDPKRNSSEYYEILALMKQSGTTVHSSTDFAQQPKPRVLDIKDILHQGAFKHPVTVPPKPTPGKTYVSKHEFLAIASNRKALKTTMMPKEQTIVDQAYVVVSKETINALRTQAQNVLDENNRIKKMSKQEFLNFADNREFMRQHILLNKK
jgi:hypothetical protein